MTIDDDAPRDSATAQPTQRVPQPGAAPGRPAPERAQTSDDPVPPRSAQSPAKTVTLPDMPRAFWVCAAGIAATFIGLLGTWATVFIVSVSGLDTDDGKILAVLAAIAAFALFRHTASGSKRSLNAVIALGVVCSLWSIAKIIDLNGEDAVVSIGWGLYLDVLAGATFAGAAVVLRKRT
ncbi:hypothetical protein GKE82_24220 [Conexibacter sp. W3-3-2]|uniref:hypothetical protein n=1 Tax=Conexibacter sp. W3-3-2 TaxID=2675227 RepID=UPI0012B94EDE|nr:hypothetical protein [Conexibacter sp. W3-3-2]MTD47315.1 hypothetical protein [Conexibacter sp. W3-3-2]